MKKLSRPSLTPEIIEMTKPKKRSRLKKLITATILASALTCSTAVPQVSYAATASSQAIGMVNTVYSTAGIQQASYRLTVDSVDKTSELTFIAQNNRSMIKLRSFATVLGATVDWDAAHKVAFVNKGATHIEIPIGAKQILVNGQPKNIDDQGTLSIILDSSTYLPFRIIAESLGYTVGYDAPTKTIIVKSAGSTTPTPPQPHTGQYNLGTIDPTRYSTKKNPDGTPFNMDVIQHIYDSNKGSKYHNGNVITDAELQTILDTVYSTPPATRGKEYNKYRYSLPQLSYATPPEPTYEEKQNMYYNQPACTLYPGQYPGIYWNGNNWCSGEDIYYGL